jgi:hypothetical protein
MSEMWLEMGLQRRKEDIRHLPELHEKDTGDEEWLKKQR